MNSRDKIQKLCVSHIPLPITTGAHGPLWHQHHIQHTSIRGLTVCWRLGLSLGHRAMQLCICQMERLKQSKRIATSHCSYFFHNSLIPSNLKNSRICINMMCLYSLSSKWVASTHAHRNHGRYFKFLSQPEVETTLNPPAVVVGAEMVAGKIKDTSLISLVIT